MKGKLLNRYISLLFLLVVAAGCGLLKKSPSKLEPAIDYRPVEGNLQPDLFLERISATKTTLHIRIPKHILSTGKDDFSEPTSLTIDTKSYTDPNNPVAFDSLTFWIEPTQSELSKPFFHKKINLFAIDNRHWVEVAITDTSKGIAQLFFLKMPNIENCSACTPYSSQSRSPLFKFQLKPEEEFYLNCEIAKPDSILVQYKAFNNTFSEKETTDSSWYEKPNNGNYGRWQREGSYTISFDGVKKPINIFVVNKNYPSLNTPNQLVEPLIYIASKNEFTTLDTTAKRKLAIDNFWLSRAGSANHARNILGNYYGRVFWANRIFAEQKPGWQTDRGKTLILLGIPEEAFSNGKTERWSYRTNKGKPFFVEFTDTDSTTQVNNFTFSKKFSKEIEKMAIDGWNTGKPINFAQSNQNQ